MFYAKQKLIQHSTSLDLFFVKFKFRSLNFSIFILALKPRFLWSFPLKVNPLSLEFLNRAMNISAILSSFPIKI